ncbi:MAG: hypothetical protein JOZ24_04195 [Candidatus Eremiobacteraeota bacterium]|nr:hypothetical protein [Candidatus Eremiobacteraeota bacterium]
MGELERIVDEDAAKTARRVVRRHKFGRLSTRRILGILQPAAGSDARDDQLLDLWFAAFERHVDRLRRNGVHSG